MPNAKTANTIAKQRQPTIDRQCYVVCLHSSAALECQVVKQAMLRSLILDSQCTSNDDATAATAHIVEAGVIALARRSAYYTNLAFTSTCSYAS
jgi:membrane-anchored protein YejM (alkaline phosphatase superfamily)